MPKSPRESRESPEEGFPLTILNDMHGQGIENPSYTLGFSPLVLTVLNRDYNGGGYYNPDNPY